MKKKLFISIVIFCTIFSLILIACNNTTSPNPSTEYEPKVEQLDCPKNLRIENKNLVWNTVPNADNYIVLINDIEYETEQNYYPVPIQLGEYQLKVMAISTQTQYKNSEYSGVINHKVDKTTLDTPLGIHLQQDTLVWQSVTNADSYTVDIANRLYSVSTTQFTIPNDIKSTQGRYSLRVMAKAGTQDLYADSQWSNLVEYHTYGQITGQEGAFGAFDDLDKNESYMGYGFDVINSVEFSSKTVKFTNPLFQTPQLLEQRLVKQYEHYSTVNTVSQQTIETFLTDWSASVNASAKFPFGSASMSASFGSKYESTINQHFMAMDIYNQSYYLALQIKDIQDYWAMLTPGFKRDLYSQDVDIDPANLFNRYGTHFITRGIHL